MQSIYCPVIFVLLFLYPRLGYGSNLAHIHTCIPFPVLSIIKIVMLFLVSCYGSYECLFLSEIVPWVNFNFWCINIQKLSDVSVKQNDPILLLQTRCIFFGPFYCASSGWILFRVWWTCVLYGYLTKPLGISPCTPN